MRAIRIDDGEMVNGEVPGGIHQLQCFCGVHTRRGYERGLARNGSRGAIQRFPRQYVSPDVTVGQNAKQAPNLVGDQQDSGSCRVQPGQGFGDCRFWTNDGALQPKRASSGHFHSLRPPNALVLDRPPRGSASVDIGSSMVRLCRGGLR